MEATAVVYEQLLLEHRQIQSRMGEPEITVQLFSPAVVPTRPSGFNAKPVILALKLMTVSVGLTVAMIGSAVSAAAPPDCRRLVHDRQQGNAAGRAGAANLASAELT